MTALCEGLMLTCFGISWPINVVKSLRARSAKGKSIFFEIVIIVGYLFGIAGKFAAGNLNIVLALYFINLAVVILDLALTIRNKRLDAERDALEAEVVTELCEELQEDEEIIEEGSFTKQQKQKANTKQKKRTVRKAKENKSAPSNTFIPALAEESLRQLR